jgi:hypothetical protein
LKPECEDLLSRIPLEIGEAIPVLLHCMEPRAGRGSHFRSPNERVFYTKSTGCNVNGRSRDGWAELPGKILKVSRNWPAKSEMRSKSQLAGGGGAGCENARGEPSGQVPGPDGVKFLH